jgi:hypothetical protein
MKFDTFFHPAISGHQPEPKRMTQNASAAQELLVKTKLAPKKQKKKIDTWRDGVADFGMDRGTHRSLN